MPSPGAQRSRSGLPLMISMALNLAAHVDARADAGAFQRPLGARHRLSRWAAL